MACFPIGCGVRIVLAYAIDLLSRRKSPTAESSVPNTIHRTQSTSHLCPPLPKPLKPPQPGKTKKPAQVAKQLEDPKRFDFFIPETAHWSQIKHLKDSVGDGLNKALAAIEEANIKILEDVLKSINFNTKVARNLSRIRR